MLRISKMTDYGVLLMAHLARAPERVYNASELAGQLRMTIPTVSKLLKLLARGGLLASYRGTKGGYRLARPPQDITLIEIIDVMEGHLGLTECTAVEGACVQEACCSLRGNWNWISQSVRHALRGINLLQMTQPMPSPLSVAICTCEQGRSAVAG